MYCRAILAPVGDSLVLQYLGEERSRRDGRSLPPRNGNLEMFYSVTVFTVYMVWYGMVWYIWFEVLFDQELPI